MAFSGGSGGDGSSGDPYQIANLADLQSWDDNWLSVRDKYFILTADIDASATSTWNAGEGWIPIGTWANPFTSNFNGYGKTITGVFINRPTTSYVGFFGYTLTGSFSNTGLINVNMTGGSDYVGSLVGLNQCTISNCYSTGALSGSGYVGGLAGRNTSGTISNCYSTVSVSGTSAVGGLVGYNQGGTTNSCYSIGVVSGTDNTGGFAGINGGTINCCFYDSETSGQSDTGKGTPKTTTEMKLPTTFTGCFNFSTIWDIIPTVSYPTLEAFGNTHTLTSANPNTGSTSGGTSITLTGVGFLEGAVEYAVSATIGGSAVTDFVVVSNTEITCKTPAGTAGAKNIVLTFLDTGTSTKTNGFTYTATSDPAVLSCVPPYGTTAGGTRVVITGTGFTTATAVTFDGIAAYSFEIISDSRIDAITPANTKGVCDVVVSIP